MSKLIKPANHIVIERTALELAATWYEIGRGQGLTSKWKTARAYAKANVEKFVPKAVEILLSMLGRSDLPDLMKEEIYEALLERHNDPTLTQHLPNIDVKKAIELHDQMEKSKPVVIKTTEINKISNSVLIDKRKNPFKSKGH